MQPKRTRRAFRLPLAARAAGWLAKPAEKNMSYKYRELESRYVIQPVATETLGVMGSSTDPFLRDSTKKVELASGARGQSCAPRPQDRAAEPKSAPRVAGRISWCAAASICRRRAI